MIDLLTAPDVARVLKVTKQTVYNLARAGELRTVTFKSTGAKWTYRWKMADVEDFVETHLRNGKPEGER